MQTVARQRHPLGMVGRVFAILGGIGLAVALAFVLLELGSGRVARAKGTVTAIEGGPRVAFTTADGRGIQVVSPVRSSFIRVGDRLAVAYDPARPQDARLDGIVGRWFAAALAGMMGGVFLLVGLGLMLAGRRR